MQSLCFNDLEGSHLLKSVDMQQGPIPTASPLSLSRCMKLLSAAVFSASEMQIEEGKIRRAVISRSYVLGQILNGLPSLQRLSSDVNRSTGELPYPLISPHFLLNSALPFARYCSRRADIRQRFINFPRRIRCYQSRKYIPIVAL